MINWGNALADDEGWHYYAGVPDADNDEDGIDTDEINDKSESASHAPNNRWQCADSRFLTA